MKICKKPFLRNAFILLICIAGNHVYAHQGNCCQEDDVPMSECFQELEVASGIMPLAANCSFNGIYEDENLFRPYIPDENSDIITIRLNLHSMQKNDGSGNFKNNMQDIAFLYKLIEELNSFLGNFQPPMWQGLTGDPYIKDSRIRCVIDGIYFHRDDVRHHQRPINNNTQANIYFEELGVDKDRSLNIFFSELLYDTISNGVAEVPLLGSGRYIPYTQIAGNGFGLNGENKNCMGLYSYYYAYITHGQISYTMKMAFAHELGHALGLMHTFQSGANNDYLSDTYSPDNSTGWCNPEADANCSNNLMGYSRTQNNLSPLQAGKMRKLLSEGWRAKMNDNSADNATTTNIYASDIWNVPRCFKGGIAIRGTNINNTTVTAGCKVFVPGDKNVEVFAYGKLVLDGGEIKNNFGRKTGIIVYQGGCLEINSSYLDKCTVTVKNGGTLIINGTLNVVNQGRINVESGGYVCVKSTARLQLVSEEDIINLYNGIHMGVNPTYVKNVTGCLPVVAWNVTGKGSLKQPGDVSVLSPYPIDMNFTGITDRGINVADVTGDGKQEVFFASRYGHLSALDHQGRELFDIDNNPNTYAGFASIGTDVNFSGIPAIGDLHGNGKLYLVAPTRDITNSPRKNSLYVYSFEDRDGDGKPDILWQNASNPTWASARGAILANIDNSADGSLEIVVGYESGLIGIYSSAGALLRTINGAASTYGAIAVADLDGDGDMEIIQASAYGVYIWHHDGRNFGSRQPVYSIAGSGYQLRSSVVVCDLDNDGTKEIVTAAIKEGVTPSEARVHVIKPSGQLLSGWGGVNQSIAKSNDWMTQEVVVGDLNGDGNLEVVSIGFEVVKVWNNRGEIISSTIIPGLNNSKSPILADIDGGNDAEIILGSIDGNLYAFKMDGSMVPGFPLNIVNTQGATACVADIDGDGKNELMVAIGGIPAGRTRVHMWKTRGNPANNEWPRERHNQHNTGEYFKPGTFLRTTYVVEEYLLKDSEAITKMALPEENRIAVFHSSEGMEIESTPERISAIRLLDISGKKIKDENGIDTHHSIIPKVSSGVYILIIELKSGKQMVKKVIF